MNGREITRAAKPLLIVIPFLALGGCATSWGARSFAEPYGFFSGLWHGFIAYFAIIGALFSDNIAVIGKPNTGISYDIGFLFGFAIYNLLQRAGCKSRS